MGAMDDGQGRWVRRRPRATVGGAVPGMRATAQGTRREEDVLAELKTLMAKPVPAGEVAQLLLEMQRRHQEEIVLAQALVAVAAVRLGGHFKVTKEEAEAILTEGNSLFIRRKDGAAYVVVGPTETDPETLDERFREEAG